ncbi:MAG TPA: molybdopterin-dependent oxidoreductase [Verrucomicrobiae bacterium]|jgi:DMSO/TMAO reductase YedYZ molybdopterin-dependent catalytic subunit|nr:molybdopterin-dependent oxidoreductase [Verrucomicrobiae bacterium]
MAGSQNCVSRRCWLKTLGAASATLAAGEIFGIANAVEQEPSGQQPAPEFTGPGANPYWTSPGQFATYPQKAPLILLTDRPVQLETPRQYFLSTFTPNDAFFVRWHLQTIPNAVDLKTWRLHVEGNVERPLALSFPELAARFKSVSVNAVNQCSGNSRSRLQPRVAGGQWGNGAMGNAAWTGVKLRDILDAAGVKSGSVQLQFEGLDKGLGPKDLGSNRFMKSLDLTNPVLDEVLVAYAMNGEPLPMLNGFPARLIVPGYFATYYVKSLSWIRVLDALDDNFWMKAAYRIPDTPRGNTTPEDMKSGKVATVPIAKMPVRSFLISPDGSMKIPAGFPLRLQGIAFSGYGAIKKVEVSADNGANWSEAHLGQDAGEYSFRTWSLDWTPKSAGRYPVAVRATDAKGNVQPDEGVWNPGGYLWNKIERQEIVVGDAS